MGHVLYFNLAPIHIAKKWHQQIISEDDPRLLSLKFPAVLPPYVVDQASYQYVDDKIHIEGEPYRKVYQKIARDTFFIKVLPDHLSRTFQNSLFEWIHSVNDNGDKKTKPGNQENIPVAIKEYVLCAFYSFYPLNNHFRLQDSIYFNGMESVERTVPTPPPRLLG